MLWIHLIKGMRDTMNDPKFPMMMEAERRKPGYRRRHIMQVTALLLLVAVLIFFWLRGWEFFIP